MAKKRKESMPAKKEPFVKEMANFKDALDEMFDNFFSRKPFNTSLPSLWKGREQMWAPEVDMYETDKDIVIEANLPGCDKKDIRVKVEDNLLTISGEKNEEKETKKKNFYQKEQQFGSFQRTLSLPRYANTEAAKASYEKGVLKVTLPKTEKSSESGKRIDVL